MSISNRFTSVPAVPQGGFTDYQTVLIGAVKENVELLTGLRGEVDTVSKAVTQGQVTVNEMGQQKLQQTSAKGSGSVITISGTDYELANLDDFRKLILDVQTLAGDVAEMRATLNFLLRQLKGR